VIRARRVALVALASFVALGLPEAVVATAWPDIADDLSRPIGDLRWLLVSYTVGYLLSSTPAGAAVSRYGVRRTASVGVGLSIAGLALYAIGPSWGWLVLAGYLLGSGAGPLDTAMNVWGTTRGPRVMNLLHACFGIGTTIGPPLTIAMAAITSWRGAFVVLILADVALLAALLTIGPDHRPAPHEHGARDPGIGRPSVAVATILVTFAVYVAIEVTAGAWGYSVLRDEYGLSPAAAGFGLSAYWGALTLGRVGLGVVGRGAPSRAVLRVGATGALVSSVVFAVGGTAGAVAGLAALGLFLAGQFPALMLLTPELVGSRRAPRVVGWSLSASGVSAALAAIAVGAQVDRAGLDVVGTNLAVASVVLLVLVLVLTGQRTPTQTARSSASGSDTTAHSSPNTSTHRSSDR